MGPLSGASSLSPCCSIPGWPQGLQISAHRGKCPHTITLCQHEGTHCFQPFIYHHSDLTVGAHFDMAKGGTCFSQVGGQIPVVFKPGSPEPSGATPRMGRVWLPASCGGSWDTFNCGQISTEERAGMGWGWGTPVGKSECWETISHPSTEEDRTG